MPKLKNKAPKINIYDIIKVQYLTQILQTFACKYG